MWTHQVPVGRSVLSVQAAVAHTRRFWRGIGKTRLALEAAARCQELFSDRAAFVPLQGLTAARHIPTAHV
jgi:hypothetical protein